MSHPQKLFKRAAALAVSLACLGALAPAWAAPVMKVFIAGLKPTSSAVLSPAPFTFPDTMVGTSSSQGFVLTNNGATTLTLSAPQVAGPYTVSNGCGTTLSPGGTCTETVTFTPTAAGVVSSTLTVTAAPAGTISTSFSGNGTEGVASLAENTLSFGNQQVGTTSAAQGVTLTNTGTAPLSVGTVTTTGSYSASTNCPSSLAVNSSCSINVTFAPTAMGAQSGTLTIPTTRGNSTVSLTGTGISSALTANTSSLAYGLVLINTQSTGQAIVITNNDGSAVKLGQISVPSGVVLTQDACSNATLAAGAQCQVTVALHPTTTGAISTSVTVPNSSYGTSVSVALTGYGGNNDALIGPVSAAYANGTTVWYTSGAGTTAPVGQGHMEALVTNNTTSPMTVTFWVSIDDELDGLKVSGTLNSFTCIVASATCTGSTTLTIPPGVVRLDFLVKNNGGPASFNTTVTNTATGAQLLNSSNTAAFYYTTTAF